jgi:hypothetical protein
MVLSLTSTRVASFKADQPSSCPAALHWSDVSGASGASGQSDQLEKFECSLVLIEDQDVVAIPGR